MKDFFWLAIPVGLILISWIATMVSDYLFSERPLIEAKHPESSFFRFPWEMLLSILAFICLIGFVISSALICWYIIF